MGHADHGHALFSERNHGVEHLLDHFRVKGGRWLIEQHRLRFHAKGTRYRHPLLLATRKLGRIFICLIKDLDAIEQTARRRHSSLARGLSGPHWRKNAIFKHRHMREQVELLKHHANFATHGINDFRIFADLEAFNQQLALLIGFKMIDAPDQGRFA